MSKKYLIIGGIVIGIVIIIILLIYIVINNGVFRFNSNESSDINTTQAPINNNVPTESEIVSVEANQGSGDYYYLSIMPLRLQSQLPNARNSSVLDYYYSKELGIAFSYEVISLVDKDKILNISEPDLSSNDTTIYLHHFNEAKESGQSIEIINIEDNLRFSNIPEIINSKILCLSQTIKKNNELCRLNQQI